LPYQPKPRPNDAAVDAANPWHQRCAAAWDAWATGTSATISNAAVTGTKRRWGGSDDRADVGQEGGSAGGVGTPADGPQCRRAEGAGGGPGAHPDRRRPGAGCLANRRATLGR